MYIAVDKTHTVYLRSVCSLRYTCQNLFRAGISDDDETCNGLHNIYAYLFGEKFVKVVCDTYKKNKIIYYLTVWFYGNFVT